MIRFSDTNKLVILRKCYYILELGINIIAAIALPPDILWIGGNNTMIIIKNNNIIIKACIKQGLYFLPVELENNTINITMDILYKRFAHINKKNLRNLIKNTTFKHTYKDSLDCSNCEICVQAELPN